MGRLTRRIGDKVIDVSNEFFELSHEELVHELFRRLADYEDMEEEKLIVKIPCKIGDKIAFKDGHQKFNFIVEKIVCDEEEIRIYGCGRGCVVYAREFNKFCNVII